MNSVNRIIVNTIAQYTKAVFNICLSLYSMRLILDALTIPDYGIYSVVGGVVVMLGFITNALVVTTQRYMSYYYGVGDYDYVGKVFANSLLIHLVVGAAVALALALAKPLFVGGVLNIDPARLQAAGTVYDISIVLLVVSVLTTPFKALFVARENIVYIAVVEMLDGVLKLIAALTLPFVAADKLTTYSWMVVGIIFVNFLLFAFYARWRFAECRFLIRRRDISGQCLRQITGFAGWTTYEMGVGLCRAQGVAIVLNHFFGTIVNAAYGIALQVYMSLSFVSSSILNAMNPQIMKAEGASDRKLMLKLSGQESKYSVALMALVSIPVIVELPAILAVWLKEVPEGTVMFCRFILIAFLFDQSTIGLHAANQAQGHIRTYTLLTNTPKLLSVLFSYLVLLWGCTAVAVMWIYIVVEVAVAVVRVPYMSRTAGLDAKGYFVDFVAPLLPVVATAAVVSWACSLLPLGRFGFVLTAAVSVAVSALVGWRTTINQAERAYITTMITNKLRNNGKR